MVFEWTVEKDISIFHNLTMKIKFPEAGNVFCKKTTIQHKATKFLDF